MTFARGLLDSSSPRISTRSPPHLQLEDYDSSSSSESPDAFRTTSHSQPRSRAPFTALHSSTGPDFLFPPQRISGRGSMSSTASSTPIVSRSASPLPPFLSSTPSSSCTSDTDSEPNSPLLRGSRNQWWREDRRRWWMIGSSMRRRRSRYGRIMRFLKKWMRKFVRHPLFPKQPITIVLTLLLLSVFAVSLTLLLIHILNPDKGPLPWHAYCAVPPLSSPPDLHMSYSPIPDTSGTTLPPFPPADLDTLPPTGLFIGIFSMDSAFERRMLVRTTWASHPRSRDGAGAGDGGAGTSRTIVRFILGQPRKHWERRVSLEMEIYNDIIILPVAENMNSGKTYTFFSWASINAWVPPVYVSPSKPLAEYSYSNFTSSPPPLAPHDSPLAWQDRNLGRLKPWVRPDYVVKVDDDSFVMLAELESRLRLELHAKPKFYHTPSFPVRGDPPASHVNANTYNDTLSLHDIHGLPARQVRSPASQNSSNDPLIYWGYLVKKRFMAGELYALSWSLAEWVANDPAVKGMTKGAEDKQTAKWMRLHPRASEIRWASERCWIYDHPRAATVYSHGFLFPSEVTRVKQSIISYLDKTPLEALNDQTGLSGAQAPTPAAWAHSSVTTFGVRYIPPVLELTPSESVEALVEGSDMSKIREGGPMTPEYAWLHREGRKTRYEDNRVGGTIVVHFIKKNMWFLETALALLEGEELSESEKFQRSELKKAAFEASYTPLLAKDVLQKALLRHHLP